MGASTRLFCNSLDDSFGPDKRHLSCWAYGIFFKFRDQLFEIRKGGLPPLLKGGALVSCRYVGYVTGRRYPLDPELDIEFPYVEPGNLD